MANASPDEQPQEVADRLQREVAELRRSRRRLAAAAYADRRAIERDLHDGVQQDLVALAVNVRRLAGLLERDPVAARALLDEMATIVREALEQTASLAERVYSPLLEARGLASAMRSAAASAGVTTLVDAPASAAYPPEITAAVHWCWLEALSSAPPGSHATVIVGEADGALIFEISVEHLADDRLEHLRDRIEALDGSITVEHRTDGGSVVHGRLPLLS